MKSPGLLFQYKMKKRKYEQSDPAQMVEHVMSTSRFGGAIATGATEEFNAMHSPSLQITSISILFKKTNTFEDRYPLIALEESGAMV